MREVTLTAPSEVDAFCSRLKDDMWHSGKPITLAIRDDEKPRTPAQNNALHKFCAMLAETLNDAGLDMRAVIKQDVDIPWTRDTVKDHLWRPIQKAMTGKQSTTEVTTVEPSEIHRVLARHLGEKLGVTCPPWPSRFGD